MSITAIVVDTSYLLELYQVPGYFDPSAAEAVISKFAAGVELEYRLFVPFGVLYETANHITDVRDGARRRELAMKFAAAVKSSATEGVPWIITPADDPGILLRLEQLLSLVNEYAERMAAQSVGLTDTSVADEARRLKDKYNQHGDHVHIWTRDRRLKALEPSPEPDAFL